METKDVVRQQINPEEPTRAVIESEKGRIEVSEKGAKVTSWKVKDSKGELQEIFYQGSEGRTGMPVLYPWWRMNGESRSQGFGRDVDWKVVDVGDNYVTMRLKSQDLDPELKKMYPYDFETDIRAEIGGDGELTYEYLVKNTGQEDMPIAPGLHPNFAIAHEDKRKIKITGGMDGFNAENIDWDNNPPDIPKGTTEAGEGKAPFPYKGKVVVSMLGREITAEDVTPGGPQMRWWNIWTEKATAKDKDFIAAAEPLTRLDNAITKDPIIVKPGQSWIWKMKFTASFT